MKFREDTTIGDPVEVQGFVNIDGQVCEVWRPATVTFVSTGKIGVAFADGERMEVPNRSALWRPA